jgi:hypothetical protein
VFAQANFFSKVTDFRFVISDEDVAYWNDDYKRGKDPAGDTLRRVVKILREEYGTQYLALATLDVASVTLRACNLFCVKRQ